MSIRSSGDVPVDAQDIAMIIRTLMCAMPCGDPVDMIDQLTVMEEQSAELRRRIRPTAPKLTAREKRERYGHAD